jgi:hypothetical protein
LFGNPKNGIPNSTGNPLNIQLVVLLHFDSWPSAYAPLPFL